MATSLLRATGLLAIGLAWSTSVAIGGAASQDKSTQDGDLPEGAGRTILQSSCTTCHDLDEVTKFKGFYTRAQWRDVVVTMVDYGAKVQPADIDVLADYLNEHLGKK